MRQETTSITTALSLSELAMADVAEKLSRELIGSISLALPNISLSRR